MRMATSAASGRVGQAHLQVGAGLDRGVCVGTAAAGDDGVVVRLREEGQRLTCAGVSSRGQQDSVNLSGKNRINDELLSDVWVQAAAHRGDEAVACPTLHQVADVDQDRSGDDGNVHEVA